MKELTQLVPIGIAFVVLTFVLAIGSSMTYDLHTAACVGTYITNSTAPAGAQAGTNAVTGGYYGCCQTMGTVAANNCTLWRTNSYGVNITQYGLNSTNEIAKWFPTIAQVTVLAVIVSVLIGALYMKFKGREE